jgi:hypothetical protein
VVTKFQTTEKLVRTKSQPFARQIGYGHHHNVFIGNRSLRGNQINEKRFSSYVVAPAAKKLKTTTFDK